MMQRPVWQSFPAAFSTLTLLALLVLAMTACQPSEQATSEAMSPEETQALLDQLPPLDTSESKEPQAADNPGAPDAPVPDDAVKSAFAVPDAPDDATATAPEIDRFSPEGAVDRASLVSITFSEPMVPVGSHADSLDKPLPVRIEPEVPGQWRWVDTRSLMFEPEGDALPMATDYTVTVQETMTALSGLPLEAPARWRFSTPALEIVDVYPSENTPLGPQPLLALTFNQAVTGDRLLAHLSLTADDQTLPLREATEEEIEQQKEDNTNFQSNAQRLVVTPTQPLPMNQRFSLTLEKGTPAQTGNRLTTAAQTHRLQTAAPLAFTETNCATDSPCTPDGGVRLTLNNPLEDDWPKEQLTLSPNVEPLDFNQYGNQIYLRGDFKPNTRYTATLKAGTRDQFGQTLSEAIQTQFHVGDYRPSVMMPGSPILTLPAGNNPRLPVVTRNIKTLDVTLRKVTPEQWPTFTKSLREQHRKGTNQVNWPGTVIDRFQVKPKSDEHQLATTSLALKQALNPQNVGHVIVTIDARNEQSAQGPHPFNRSLQQALWVQVTNLSASTYATAEGITAWVTRLDDGQPVPDATFRLAGNTAVTDQSGTATLINAVAADDVVASVTVSEDSLLLPTLSYRQHYFQFGNLMYPALTFTDRGLYRPGESVRLKGIIRQRAVTPEGDIALPADIDRVSWTAYDGNREEVDTGEATLNPMGAFDVTLRLPESAASGTGRFEITIENGSNEDQGPNYYQSFQIEEFRRPEYEVQTTLSEPAPVAGQSLDATVTANYYSGGPLPNADVQWHVSLRESHYAPPGWEDYVFGRWQPIWGRGLWPTPEPEKWRQSFEGTTDASGTHRLTLEPNNELALDSLLYPHRLTAESTVTDVNRQQWTDRDETLMHPANHYVGLRTNSLFAQKGEAVTLEWVVVDIDGSKRETGPPTITVERLAWEDGEQTVEATLPCKPAAEAGQCQFTPEQAGQYRLTAAVTDTEDRKNQTQMTLWVTGSEAPPPFGAADEDLEVQLIPDREEYQPGDTAKIQIQTPFDNAQAFITIQRMGLKDYRQVQLENGQYTLSVPITDTSMPSLTVSVEAVASEKPATKSVPPHATGDITLPVSTASRALTVDVSPSESKLKPGEESRVSISVSDHNGQPFEQGEVTLYVVDESVLSMGGYIMPDAMALFYSELPPLIAVQRSRGNVFDQPEEDVQAIETAFSADRQLMEVNAPQARKSEGGDVSLRTNFNPLATFQSTVTLDQNGKASVDFTLPDTLTRYRMIAVAYGEKQFGTGESDLTVGLSLMVRPSLPRFLNLGDKAELPVVVQNTTDEPMTVELALRAGNLTLTGAQGRRLTIPANDRYEARFTAQPQQVGDARVQVIVRSDEHQDAAEITLPVQRPATREAFAQYGSLTDGNEFLQVAVPEDVYADFGGLNLSTSSTQFQSLTDAFLYLLEYPYGCSEQIASRLMAIASLEDLLDAFNADGLPEKEAIRNSVDDILARLSELQNPDGGWSFWTRNGDSRPYLSVHVTHALLRARQAGYPVPSATLDRALTYTQKADMKLTNAMSGRASNSIKAYALYVLALADQPDPKAAIALYEQSGDDLSLEAMGWLLNVVAGDDRVQAMREDIERRLNYQLRETAATASFVDDYNDGGHWVLHGSRRTDAVVLEALLTTRPDSDLIEKLARGLLNERRNGHWGNTQENVFALLALKAYFLARESDVPDLTARAWLGDRFLGETHFQGRTAEPQRKHLPMSALKAGSRTPTLALQHQGTGRLYYRLGMEYAPEDLQLDAASHGFRVERHYEAVNDPDDVKRAKDGTWEIKAGAAVRVRLTMTLPARRHHVALTDRMPAGFEALNPALDTTAEMPVHRSSLTATQPRDWHPRWYQHDQLRDDRAEAFSTEVEAGVYHYEYTALATTPGDFVVPPAKAEEMYRPETFGRSSTERVRIVETP